MFKENEIKQGADFFGISSSTFGFSEFSGPWFSMLPAASEKSLSVSSRIVENLHVYKLAHTFSGVLCQLVLC